MSAWFCEMFKFYYFICLFSVTAYYIYFDPNEAFDGAFYTLLLEKLNNSLLSSLCIKRFRSHVSTSPFFRILRSFLFLPLLCYTDYHPRALLWGLFHSVFFISDLCAKVYHSIVFLFVGDSKMYRRQNSVQDCR